jgi:ATP-dependent Clp protease adapter protein ClpS
MHKFKHGELHSGSKKGPLVKNRQQAIAIMLSEKRKGEGEVDTGPSDKIRKKHKMK